MNKEIALDKIAKYMAETYNGGNWDDPQFYTETQRNTHRLRALRILELLEIEVPVF